MQKPWHLIFFSMLFYALGEYMSKLYGNKQKPSYAVWAILGYMVPSCMFLPIIVRWNNLAALGTVWNVCYLFITLFIAFVCFHEHVSATQVVGIGFGIISIILLSL